MPVTSGDTRLRRWHSVVIMHAVPLHHRPAILPPAEVMATDLVDDPTQADALAQRWRGPANDEPPRPGLLLIDPIGGPGTAMLSALGNAVGRPVTRSRLLSPLGLRVLAVVDELTPAIAAPGPSAVRCVHLRRPESLQGSLALQSLLSASDLVAVLSGALSPPELARWMIGACALARQHQAAAVLGPRWLLFSATPPRAWPEDQVRPAWMAGVSFVPQPVVSQSSAPGALWNSVLAAWMAAGTGGGRHLSLRPVN